MSSCPQEDSMVEMQGVGRGPQRTVFEREHGDVEFRHVEPLQAAVVRVRTAATGLPGAIGDALREIMQRTAGLGIETTGAPFTRYLSFGGPELTAEVGIPVEGLGPVPTTGRMTPSRLPGGRIASIVHVGAYERLDETYAALAAELEARGLAPTGPMWETYWSDPATDPDPGTWRTEICLPLD
jgi:effector-binding domain-containing protein